MTRRPRAWCATAPGRLVLVPMLLLAVLVACSGGPDPAPGGRDAVPLPAATPYLVMTDRTTGWAVWPGGSSWLVLRTTDGWEHSENATPVGVPTAGGLALAVTSEASAVAVEPYDRLLSSPVLTRTGAAPWAPGQLPGAVAAARSAVALRSGTTTAVLRTSRGTVVAKDAGAWTTVTMAARLTRGRGLWLDAVTWADSRLGWLTGHGTGLAPVAFQTMDGGHTWTPVPLTGRGALAALAPCRTGPTWVLPVIGAGGRVVFHRTADGGGSWAAGGSLPVATGLPAWGCAADRVWSAGGSDTGDRVFSSADGGSRWADRGPAPRGLADLAPVGGGTGYATSVDGDAAVLWAVTADGARFRQRALPGWVDTLGGAGSTS